MRTTDAGQNAEVIKASVAPFHICRLGLSVPAFLSEGFPIVFAGDSYTAGGVEVSNISFSSNGFESAKVKLLDYSGSAISLALSNKLSDISCKIWLVYRTGVGAYTNPIQLVEGVVDPDAINADEVTLKIIPANIKFEMLPQIYCNKDSGFLHLAKSGDILEIGTEKFELKN